MIGAVRAVILLRGINVGGNRKVPMARLRAVLEGAGAADVRTYIQSGNVVLDHDGDAVSTTARYEAAIAEAFGFEVPLVHRSADEWAAMVDANPYPHAVAEPSTLHVLFLADPPARGRIDALDLGRFAPEEATPVGRDLFLHLPGGMGRSKLAPALNDRALGTRTTARNWNTVVRLGEMLATP